MQLMYTPATNFVFVGQWPVWTGFEQNLQVSFTAKIVPSPVSSRNQRDTRLFQAWFSWGWHHLFILDHLSLVGGLVAIFEIFPEILGMSSSQVTKSYFSEGWVYNHQPDQMHIRGMGFKWWFLDSDEPWHQPGAMALPKKNVGAQFGIAVNSLRIFEVFFSWILGGSWTYSML